VSVSPIKVFITGAANGLAEVREGLADHPEVELVGTAADPMTKMFIADLTEGIAETGIKAAFLKCAIDAEGLTEGVERVLRCASQAHLATGAPLMVHTHPESQSGLIVLRILREEGVSPSQVVLAHSGDTTDLDYLTELADSGCLLGMDRFGLDLSISADQRVATVVTLCEQGYAASLVLSHDAACHIDWFRPEQIPAFAPAWHFEHLFDDVLPALQDAGVTTQQIETMLVDNPRRFFSAKPDS